MKRAALVVRGLRARVEGTEVLRGVDMEVGEGELCALMGRNGSGKSTLAHVLSGKPGVEATGGEVLLFGEDLLGLSVEERAARGVFLAFQRAIPLPGVTGMTFLRTSLEGLAKLRGEGKPKMGDMLKRIRGAAREAGADEALLRRGVNEGFSGGESRRLEAVQMLALRPRLAVLDEIDSGLDVDGAKLAASAATSVKDCGGSVLAISHYARFFRDAKPDRVYVMEGGVVVEEGGAGIAERLEEEGYG